MEKSEERGFPSYCHRKQKNGTKRISELVNSPLTKYTYSETWNLRDRPVICGTSTKSRSKSNVVHKVKLNWCTVNPSKVWPLLISDRLSKLPNNSQSMHSSWTSCQRPPSLYNLGGASYYKPSCCLCLLSRGLQHCFTSGVLYLRFDVQNNTLSLAPLITVTMLCYLLQSNFDAFDPSQGWLEQTAPSS